MSHFHFLTLIFVVHSLLRIVCGGLHSVESLLLLLLGIDRGLMLFLRFVEGIIGLITLITKKSLR